MTTKGPKYEIDSRPDCPGPTVHLEEEEKLSWAQCAEMVTVNRWSA